MDSKTDKRTFRALYQKERRKPSPAQTFITEVAQLTMRSEITVRLWACGVQAPDDLTQSVLSEWFGISPEELFPKCATPKKCRS